MYSKNHILLIFKCQPFSSAEFRNEREREKKREKEAKIETKAGREKAFNII